MKSNRLTLFILLMFILMLASQYYLAGRENILMMPAVLAVYAIMTIILRTGKDYLLNIMVAYGMSHFHFATKAGMLGPWLSLTILVLQGTRFAFTKASHKNQALVPYIAVFLILNLLGLMFKNPNSTFENLSSFISLVGLMVVLMASSKLDLTKADLKFIIQVFGIMTLYTCFSSVNTSLGFIRTRSPLLTLNEIYYGSALGVAMFGRSYSEYFLCMNMFFANMLTVDTTKYFNVSKNSIVAFYLSSFLGCMLGFSKTMTVLIIVGNILVLSKMKIVNNLKSVIRVFATLGVLIIILVVAQQFMNLTYIFERFEQQPEIFKRVWEAPLTAEGTSRDVSFYWGWRRNLDFNWVLGYGWSPADANNSAYFHGLTINTRKHDFHNLYLSIFPIFGWLGGMIFLTWLIKCFSRSFKISVKSFEPGKKIFGSGMFWLIVVFMIGEYALPITSEPNYFFILIVWMGLVNSLFNGMNTNIAGYENNSSLDINKVITQSHVT